MFYDQLDVRGHYNQSEDIIHNVPSEDIIKVLSQLIATFDQNEQTKMK